MKNLWNWLAAIFGLLIVAAIIFPVFASAHGGSRRQPAGISNARQCVWGIKIYAADNDDLFPYVRTVDKLIVVTRPYVKNDQHWQTLNGEHPGKYNFNPSVPGVAFSSIREPSKTPLIYDLYGRPDPWRPQESTKYFMGSYSDGHGMNLKESAWVAAQPYLYLSLKRQGRPIEP